MRIVARGVTSRFRVQFKLLERCANAHIILEIEAGVVGGEEDGVVGEINDKLYTTPEDMLAVALKLGLGENGRYMLRGGSHVPAMHGVYRPGAVVLRPDILSAGEDHCRSPSGVERPFDLVFHGGSRPESLPHPAGRATTLRAGRVMNVDTDTQYAYTHAPAFDHMLQLRRETQGRR